MLNVAQCWEVFKECAWCGLGFEPNGSTTATCGKTLSTYALEDPSSNLLATSILWGGVFHWLAIHSNRYLPHNTTFLPPLCPTSQPRNFLYIVAVCTENILENFNIIACSGAIMRMLNRSDKSRISVRFILLYFKNGGWRHYWTLMRRKILSL
jgi:hypothetical protein